MRRLYLTRLVVCELKNPGSHEHTKRVPTGICCIRPPCLACRILPLPQRRVLGSAGHSLAPSLGASPAVIVSSHPATSNQGTCDSVVHAICHQMQLSN